MEINFNLNSIHHATWNHAAGVLGLLQSLEAISTDNPYQFKWQFDDRNLSVSWEGDSVKAWDWLIRRTFQLVDGIIVLPGNRVAGNAHIGMLETILQIPATRPMEGSTMLTIPVAKLNTSIQQQLSYDFNTLKLKNYIHQNFAKKLFTGKRIVVTSWLLPNCLMTHPDVPSNSKLNWSEFDEGAIALLFSHIVTGHYFSQKPLNNGKFVRTTALCTPFVTSLKQRIKFESTLIDIYAGSLADAAYRYAQLNECAVQAYEYKSKAANRPAKIINSVEVYVNSNYDRIRENFPNSWKVSDEQLYFFPNHVRGYIATNLSNNRPLFEGITEETSNLHPKQLFFNRNNLRKEFFS